MFFDNFEFSYIQVVCTRPSDLSSSCPHFPALSSDCGNKPPCLQGQCNFVLWFSSHILAAGLRTNCHTSTCYQMALEESPKKLLAPENIKAVTIPLFILPTEGAMVGISGGKGSVASTTWGQFRSMGEGHSGQGRQVKSHAISKAVARPSVPESTHGKALNTYVCKYSSSTLSGFQVGSLLPQVIFFFIV